jgi:hypothetical protein
MGTGETAELRPEGRGAVCDWTWRWSTPFYRLPEGRRRPNKYRITTYMF